MEKIKDENIREMRLDLTESLHHVYGEKLKSVVLYGSAARGTQTGDSDIDVMIFVDGDNDELRLYEDLQRQNRNFN